MPDHIVFKLHEANLHQHTDAPPPQTSFLKTLKSVRFEEWDSFDRKINSTEGMLHDLLSPSEFADATIFLRAARRTVKPTHLPYGSQSLPIFSDCSSLQPVHANIMSAVQDLLQRVKGTRQLVLKSINEFRGYQNMLGRIGKKEGRQILRDEDKIPDERIPSYTLVKLRNAEATDDIAEPPVCAFHLEGPCADILGSGLGRFARFKRNRTTAKELCARYNSIFSKQVRDTNNANGRKNMDQNISALFPVSRAISYALSVGSGCVFLHNYNDGVAFEIFENQSCKNCDHVHVRVSGSFHRENEKGTVVAMLAISLYSMIRIKSTESVPGYIRSVRGGLEKVLKDMQQAERPAQPGEKRPTTGGEPPSKRVRFIDPGSNPNPTVLSIQQARQLVREKQVGKGNSGNVYLAWLNRWVVIKEWNRKFSSGLKCLVNEVSIIGLMSRHSPSLFGSIVPNFSLAWAAAREEDHKVHQPLIVMDFVGENISRDDNGRLFFGEEKQKTYVNGIEEQSIYESARAGLEELHRNGFLHGSIGLRNIRVQPLLQITMQGMFVNWTVWWIDFGRTTKVQYDRNGDFFINERDECREMFRTRQKQPSARLNQ